MSKLLLSLAAIFSCTNNYTQEDIAQKEACFTCDETTLVAYNDIQKKINSLRRNIANASNLETILDKEQELNRFFYRFLEAHANIFIDSVRTEIFNNALCDIARSTNISLRDKLLIFLGLRFNYVLAKIKFAQDEQQGEQIKLFEEKSLTVLDELITELETQITTLEKEIAQLEEEIEKEDTAAQQAMVLIAQLNNALNEPISSLNQEVANEVIAEENEPIVTR